MAEEINIKVKTLDSSVHEFTVAKNIPVPELKARIAEKTNVPVGMQRIIFKGKVLRDENDLSAYGVQDGHTIHMVERPAQTDAPPQQTTQQTQAQQQPQQQQQPLPGQPQAIPGANVMVGIQLGEGGDLGQIVNNVLQGMGIPAQANAGQPNVIPPGAEYDHVRQLLTNITNALNTPAIELGAQPTLPAVPNPPANSVEHLGQLLGQLNEQLRVVQPAVERLSQLLRVESVLADANARTQAQQIATRIHTPLQQLGLVQNLLAARLATVRVNDTPGSARVQAQQTVIAPNGNIAFRIHPGGPAGPGQPTAIPVFRQQGPQQGAPNAQPNAQPAQGGPAPFNFANIFGGIMQAADAATQQAAHPQQPAQPGANAQQPIFNNILNQVLNSLQMPNQPPQQAPQQGAQPQQVPNAFGTMMTQMLAGLTQMNPLQQQAQQPAAQPTPAPGSQPAPQAAPAPGSQPAPAPQQGAPQPNTQPALTQMFNIVASALANPASSGNNSVGSILRGISDDNDEPPLSPEIAPLADVIQVFFDSITMPELLAIMQGQWAAIDRAQAPLATYIRETTLQGDTSRERIQGFANDVTNALRESVGETILPPALISHVQPGRDLLAALSGVMQRNVVTIFELVLTQFTPTPEDPHPFSTRVVTWVRAFVRELVDGIAECMTGGVADAQAVVHRFLEQRLSFMGNVAGMAATMVTEYIMRTYHNNVAQNQNQQAQIQSQQSASPQHSASTVTTTTPNSTTTTTTITFTTTPVTTTTFHSNVNPASPTPAPSSTQAPSPTPVAVPRPTPTPTPAPTSSPTPARTTPAPVAKPAATPALTPAPTASTPKPAPSFAKYAPTPNPTPSPPTNAYPPTKVPSTASDSTIPEEWQKTIKEDEQRQVGIKQNPFSDAYGSGSASKRRKAQMELEKSTAGAESLFNSRLEEALAMSSKNNNNNASQDADAMAAQAGPLRSQYLKLLAQQLAARVQSDRDFEPSRYPLTTATFTPSTSTTTTTTTDEEEEERKIQEALNQS